MVTISIMNDEDFEWNDDKAAANLRDHKISFQQARRVDAFVLIEQDLSQDYGEDRFLAIGRIDSRVVTVVLTERGDRTRIISARKATADERRAYDQSQTT
jgi:uncharacterized protein